MSKALHFDSNNFQQEVLNSSQPVLVDFWAPWCGPCRLVGPTIDELSEKLGDRAKVGKLNIDESPETAAQYGISSIPTVLVFNHGRVVGALIGVQSESAYHSALERAAA